MAMSCWWLKCRWSSAAHGAELGHKEGTLYDEIMKQAEQNQMLGQAGAPRRFTLTEQLEAEKRTLTDRLAQLEKVLAALKANPSFQELFDLISKYR